MSAPRGDILLIGFGNPGRLDDGLGPALAEAVEALGIEGVTVEAGYQLDVEDAADVATHKTVVFADADATGPAPFSFRRVEPAEAMPLSFSSHSVQPEALLATARDLFGHAAEAYMLGIRGCAFDAFGESLSERAQDNLAAALAFIEPVLRERSFKEVAQPPHHEVLAVGTPCKETR